MWELSTSVAEGLGLSGIQLVNNQEQKPLTLTLSRRERGLTELHSRSPSTCNTESNSDSEQHEDLLPFPLAPLGERAGVRGWLLIWASDLRGTQFLATATQPFEG
jgi:hypothetical protein